MMTTGFGELDDVLARSEAHRRQRADAMLDRVLMVGPAATAEHIRADIRTILELHDEDTWAFSMAATDIIREMKSKKFGAETARRKMLDLARANSITVDTETGMREMMEFIGAVERAAAPLFQFVR
jgi:hypothetical protein